jgi:hypothetical protein
VQISPQPNQKANYLQLQQQDSVATITQPLNKLKQTQTEDTKLE